MFKFKLVYFLICGYSIINKTRKFIIEKMFKKNKSMGNL